MRKSVQNGCCKLSDAFCAVYTRKKGRRAAGNFTFFRWDFWPSLASHLKYIYKVKEKPKQTYVVYPPPPHRSGGGGGHFLDQSNTYKIWLLP